MHQRTDEIVYYNGPILDGLRNMSLIYEQCNVFFLKKCENFKNNRSKQAAINSVTSKGLKVYIVGINRDDRDEWIQVG